MPRGIAIAHRFSVLGGCVAMLFDHFEGTIGKSVGRRRKEERGIGADMRLTLRTAKCAARDL